MAAPQVPQSVSPEAVRDELSRVLAHSLFRNSRRYPSLLRHIVERTLEGRAADLKERTLGVEVFGRDANYDTNVDPIVRISACEIRKRLTQFYQQDPSSGELRIELPLGSYVAEFRTAHEERPAAPIIAMPSPVAEAPEPAHRPSRRRVFTLAGAAMLVLTAGGVAWRQAGKLHGPLERFWEPVLCSEAPVVLCLGQHGRVDDTAMPAYARQMVPLGDVRALANMMNWLSARGKHCAVKGTSSTTLADLRTGPAVLVGAFNNDWTMRLRDQLRFIFDHTGPDLLIRDTQNSKQIWGGPILPTEQIDHDYALITRVHDPTTGQLLVVAGGIHNVGTIAASEFLSDPHYMETVEAKAPRGWWQKNLQIVLSTRVIEGSPAPPTLEAVHVF